MTATKTFLASRSGSFAPYLALATIPLLGAAGMAVDYYSLSLEKRALQISVDSAVLAVASAGDKITLSEAEGIAEQYLAANYQGVVKDVVVNRNGSRTQVIATGTQKLIFGPFLGRAEQDLTVSATADLAIYDYEIGLSLDTTGSMAGGKLASLKDAAKTMIDEMSTAMKGKGTLKFALVPFSSFVNVGPQYAPTFDAKGNVTKAGASWLDTWSVAPLPQSDLDVYVNRFALYQKLGVAWPGCVETRQPTGKTAWDVTDTAPDAKVAASLFTPAFSPDEPDDKWSYPNSYIADGGNGIGSGDVEKRMRRYGAPSSWEKENEKTKDTKAIMNWKKVVLDQSMQSFYGNYPVAKGPGFNCDAQPMVPLTTDFTGLKKTIDSLVARGSTNIVEGMMWGWRVLSSREPFTEGAKEGSSGNRKILVLLTDGTNSYGNLPNMLSSGYGSYGYIADARLGAPNLNATATTSAMDAKVLAGCTNAKDDGLEIYTILLEESNAKTSALLEKCASDPDHYFNVPDHDQLKAVFGDIVKKVSRLRLSS